MLGPTFVGERGGYSYNGKYRNLLGIPTASMRSSANKGASVGGALFAHLRYFSVEQDRKKVV